MKNKIEELIQDAELGNVDSQFQLGKMYFTGHGIKQDLLKAFNWWKTAAEHNEPKSQLCLSCMYRYGDIVEINKEYADELYDKSTYYLEYSIQNNIIDMYNEFRNIEKDTDTEELYWIAFFFDQDGNYKQAKRYYERAMSLGNISAKEGLGILYLEGNGVKKNYKKAYELFYEAAQQNSNFAQWLIGTMYSKAYDFSKTLKESYRVLINHCADPGKNYSDEISNLIEQILNLLPTKEITELTKILNTKITDYKIFVSSISVTICLKRKKLDSQYYDFSSNIFELSNYLKKKKESYEGKVS